MNKSLHILGAGILTECAVDLIINENLYTEILLYDDSKEFIHVGSHKFNVAGTVEGGIREIKEKKGDFIVLLGINHRKKALEIINDFHSENLYPVNLISKFAHVSKSVKFGHNLLVFPGAIIGSNVIIGDYLICYSNVSVEHHITIGNGVALSPGVRVASKVTINDLSFIGIGSIISNNLVIGRECIVGAGSLILHSLPDLHLAYGTPAKSRQIDDKINL